ncbi:MAG: hypothetical protein WD872_19785 [Pirellulaceae bacterium]
MSQAHQPLVPPAGGVAVRMYRQGLGDCFLLAFAAARRKRPAYVLIDCGVHRSQTSGNANLRSIVADIVATTGGRLDVLVATHQHTDHLSGFVTEARQFVRKKLRIGRLWLGWTEDLSDPVAEQLGRPRRAAQQALEAALEKLEQKAAEPALAGHDLAALALHSRLDAARSFFELSQEGSKQSLPALAARVGLNDPTKATGPEVALAVLKKYARTIQYLRPGGAPVAIPGVRGARAYILGPPADVALLRKSNPSSGSRQETYLTESTDLLSFAAAAVGQRDEPEDAASSEQGPNYANERCNPFSEQHRVSYQDACEREFFQEHYGLGEPGHKQAWRQIESDWLFTADALGLDLDNHTNNTSLALAFEVGSPGRGRVLLFAADAQVGSWLSWGDLVWTGKKPITVTDLFSRTVLYKVGHHASHNATLKRDRNQHPYGLERMPGGLVAMIPVDAAVARKLPGWHMPDPRLYAALEKKAGGRILRSDDHPAGGPTTEPTAVPGVPGAQWRSSLATKVARDQPLYYDLMLAPRDSNS